MLERVPEAHLAWKPHAKSWSLGELSTHLVTLVMWMEIVLETEELDLAVPLERGRAPASRDELLTRFDAQVATLREALERSDDAALSATWTLRHGTHVLQVASRLMMIRLFALNHSIHHRGQLSVYLRLLDTPLPGIYGPTADDARA